MSEDSLELKEELLSGRTSLGVTHGRSMEPLLHDATTCVLVEPLERELRAGELPVFLRKDGSYVAHRIIRTEGDYYYTRGDNCTGTEKVPKSHVVGVVSGIIRNDKVTLVTDLWYRVYVRFWMILAPIRIPILKWERKTKQFLKKYRGKLRHE